MKTVGEILKTSRLAGNLTLEEVSRKTRIQEAYLDALEKNDFKHLPTLTFVKGFIQNYAKAISLDPATALAIFRRDFAPNAAGRIVPRSLITPIQHKLMISPATATTGLIVGIVAFLVLVFARQILIFYQGPTIEIDTPNAGEQVISPLRIAGKVTNAVAITINSQPTGINQNDTFAQEIQLSPGDHTVTVIATSRDGKTATLQRQVTVSP